MNYQFPYIEHIDQVLEAIRGRKEFVVADREDYVIVNYQVALEDTFDLDESGAMRRECRGLAFDRSGRLISRPFHKFFNVNEREETQSSMIDITKPHVILEKVDGSMIRPLIVNDCLRLGTKMGVTDVAMQAEEWLASQSSIKREWMRSVYESKKTPIFEWVSLDNRVVLEYENADLVYLGTRDNYTGLYSHDHEAPFTSVTQHPSVVEDLSSYVSSRREMTDREGDVIRFHDGHMVKVKNDWYVRIHKTRDLVRFDRNVVDLILNQSLDDVLSMLPDNEARRVKSVSTLFTQRFNQKREEYDRLWNQVKTLDRKTFATQHAPSLDKRAVQYVFSRHDGKDERDIIISLIQKSVGNTTRWEDCASWLGMNS